MPTPGQKRKSGSQLNFKLTKIGIAILITVSLCLGWPKLPIFNTQSSLISRSDSSTFVSAGLFSDYQIDGYRVDLSIHEDGSIGVTESIDLFFKDESESLAFNLPLEGATSLRFDSVTIAAVSSTGEAVSQIEVLPAASAEQSGNQTLSYTLKEVGSGYRLNVGAFVKAGVAQRYSVSYTLQGGLFQVDQTAVLRRSFFNALGPRRIVEPILMIHYPIQVPAADVWYRVISKSSFLDAQVDANTIQMSAVNLPAGQKMEAAITLPLAKLPAGFSVQSGSNKRQLNTQTIEQEVLQLNQATHIRDFLISLIGILLLLAGLGFAFLHLVFDREGLLQLRRTIKPQLDNPWRPAMLARLFDGHHPGQLLLGTLLDLVQRGHLKLDGHVFQMESDKNIDYSGLAAYEIFLLQWLFERVTLTSAVSPSQIRKYALNHRTAAEFSAYYEQFILLIQDELITEKLVDSAKVKQGRRIGVTLATLYFGLTGVLGILTLSWVALLLLFPGILYLLYGLKLRHLTGEGNRQADIGRVYRQTLRFFEQHQPVEPLSGEQLAANLPQAVALGVTHAYLQQVSRMTNNKPDQLLTFLRTFSRSLIAADPANQLIDFRHDLEAMDSMLSASLYLALGFHFYE